MAVRNVKEQLFFRPVPASWMKFYQMKQEHHFHGDPDGPVADAQHDVGQDRSSVGEVSGHRDGQVDQEEDWEQQDQVGWFG